MLLVMSELCDASELSRREQYLCWMLDLRKYLVKQERHYFYLLDQRLEPSWGLWVLKKFQAEEQISKAEIYPK